MARGSKPAPRTNKRNAREEARAKKKGCMFSKNDIDQIDYKDYEVLRTLVTEKGKIRSRRTSGLSRRHQNQAATAIKRAREAALLPYPGA